MMNLSIVTAVITTVLVTLISVSSVAADDKSHAVLQFNEACGTDIETYCSKVQPGDGRISACLYAHTPLLTDDCYAVTERMGMLLEGIFDGVETFNAACAGDLREFCSDKQPGAGEVLACLRENRAHISLGCDAAMPSRGAPTP